MNSNNNNMFTFDINEKSERIIELENNPEFKKLPYHQQVILLTGEKLLQIDQKLRLHTSYLNDYILQYGNAITDVVQNQKNIQNYIKKLIKDETTSLTKDLKNKGAIASVDEEKMIELIEEKYSQEISNMENRLEYATQQTIKNFDETIYDTLEKIDNLTQFEIKAREELQKNQDRIYLLEEEIARQKEINESLEQSFKERLEEFSKNAGSMLDSSSSIFNYKYYDSRFDSIEELENFIKGEAKKIAKDEVEKYIHDYNLFSEERNDELIEKLFEEGQLKESEVSKVYQLQLENNNRMSDLEHLLDEQNRQIKLLSEDRQNLVLTLSDVIKGKDVDVAKVLETLPFKNFDDEFVYKEKKDVEKAYDIDPSNILSKNEMEILVKKQAIELVKEKIEILNQKKTKISNLKEIQDNKFADKELQNYFEQTNRKIADLESQLKEQIKENHNLKNDLFDEISKNNFDIENNELLKENNGIINNNEIQSVDWENLTEEELMKHNYYNGSTPIPGTKITRINNYKINNDLNSSNFSNDAQDLIKQDAQKVVQETQPVKEASWVENTQKLIDLENLISRQDEEIRRLRDTKPVENTDNSTLSNIDESIKEALITLQNLTSAQEKTKKEIEETNKKIQDLESQLKRSKTSEFEDELARKELDRLMEEKYKQHDVNYSDEIKKIEAERRKIEETLELERIRLLSEIEANRKRLEEAPTKVVQQAVVVEKETVIVEEPKKVELPVVKPQPKEDVKFVLEAPKKKRKQQLFFEIKTHSTPKLTKADLEK